MSCKAICPTVEEAAEALIALALVWFGWWVRWGTESCSLLSVSSARFWVSFFPMSGGFKRVILHNVHLKSNNIVINEESALGFNEIIEGDSGFRKVNYKSIYWFYIYWCDSLNYHRFIDYRKEKNINVFFNGKNIVQKP